MLTLPSPNKIDGHSSRQQWRRYDKEQAAMEGVDVELSQQMEALSSPSNPPAPKKKKKKGNKHVMCVRMLRH